MKQELKTKRNIEKLAALLGLNTDTATVTKHALEDTNYQPAEATLYFLENPKAFMKKECKRCGEVFGTSYHAVAYCSDNCRIKALQNVGLQWTPGKRAQDRWAGQPPLLIPPAALKLLLEWAMMSKNEESQASELIEQPLLNQEHTDPYPQAEIQTTVPIEQPQLEFSFLLPEVTDAFQL